MSEEKNEEFPRAKSSIWHPKVLAVGAFIGAVLTYSPHVFTVWDRFFHPAPRLEATVQLNVFALPESFKDAMRRGGVTPPEKAEGFVMVTVTNKGDLPATGVWISYPALRGQEVRIEGQNVQPDTSGIFRVADMMPTQQTLLLGWIAPDAKLTASLEDMKVGSAQGPGVLLPREPARISPAWWGWIMTFVAAMTGSIAGVLLERRRKRKALPRKLGSVDVFAP